MGTYNSSYLYAQFGLMDEDNMCAIFDKCSCSIILTLIKLTVFVCDISKNIFLFLLRKEERTVVLMFFVFFFYSNRIVLIVNGLNRNQIEPKQILGSHLNAIS